MRTTVLMLALLVTAQAASAQDACTYDECALKVTRGFLGTSILKGTEEERVARIILLAPHLDLFAQRSDSAGLYYEAFRGHTALSCVDQPTQRAAGRGGVEVRVLEDE